ncbi:MAG TPA: type IV toxin-antitoxin system AbiEi family antitoxin domain-containing protein [Microlunatus sp.]
MRNVILTRDLTRQGFTTTEVARLERNGDLVRLRRGAYVRDEAQQELPDGDDEHVRLATRHRQLIEATLGQLHPRAVISHGSAAVLHGLPVFTGAVQSVHVTRDRHGGGARRSVVQVHGSRLRGDDVVLLDGIALTSLARTVGDLARTLPFEQGVAVGDQALRLGLELDELAVVLELAARWVGAVQARRVAAFLDKRSESVGESFSRVRCHELGLPVPDPQYDVFDEQGLHVGRADFGWPELRTLGEFDGKSKYLRLRRKDETIEEAVIREKLREDRLRDLGWQVVRWIWAELFRAEVIAERLHRAFARGRR